MSGKELGYVNPRFEIEQFTDTHLADIKLPCLCATSENYIFKELCYNKYVENDSHVSFISST